MLTDRYFRRLNYLRVSITDKCNLRCTYCMPPEGVEFLPHDEVLRNEEFVHLIELFFNLGVKKVRFTGGEPLMRKGFIDIVAGVRESCPEMDLCLTTNGILLDRVINDLRKYNVSKLNISLDSLSRQGYAKITGMDYLDKLLSNIDKALSMDFFNLKINTVLHEDILDELDDFLEYFKDKNVIIRFIEKMPFSDQENKIEITYNDLLEELKKRGSLIRNEKIDSRVAIMYEMTYKQKYNIKIGIIPPVTHCFCSQCNRLRLTCDGYLKTCLHSNNEYNLKDTYRMDMGDEALKDIILRAVAEKPEKHNLYCDSLTGNVTSLVNSKRTMSKIGG